MQCGWRGCKYNINKHCIHQNACLKSVELSELDLITDTQYELLCALNLESMLICEMYQP